ncbi:MAG: thioredoxin family protein [Bacteroidetes bacterium HGW-Bacteroidetes-17]|jgi:peroxiredoxin|nr:MAG: thioredoxin family protein [Bacteroidetes bacterium HGW-Bacteroidetes-17]
MKKTIIFIFALVLSTAAFADGLKVGDKASNFTLKDVEGKMVSLSDYNSAKGVILTFTCNVCPYAIAYQDRLIAIDKKYKELGYPVVAINPNDPEVQPGDSYEAMHVRAHEKGYTFPYLFDEGQAVYPAYGATRTPHVFLLENKGGEFVVRYIGAIDDNYADATAVKETYLEDAISALLAGKTPLTAETKAIGCSIKTK